MVYSLAPGRFQWNFRKVIFKQISIIDHWGMYLLKMALKWLLLDLTDHKSTLVQVMAWCCQVTSHYLSQCWPSPMSPYDVTRPQWVKKWSKTWAHVYSAYWVVMHNDLQWHETLVHLHTQWNQSSNKKKGNSQTGILSEEQYNWDDVKGLVQDCSISSALVMNMLQSCTEPTMYSVFIV